MACEHLRVSWEKAFVFSVDTHSSIMCRIFYFERVCPNPLVMDSDSSLSCK